MPRNAEIGTSDGRGIQVHGGQGESMASDNAGCVEAISAEVGKVNKRARQILDVCDVLKDLLARHDRGGFYDLMPYADRILKKVIDA